MITVKKLWKPADDFSHWDEVCQWCIGQFGLPGRRNRRHRWNTQSTVDAMWFDFEQESDAALFIMKWL